MYAPTYEWLFCLCALSDFMDRICSGLSAVPGAIACQELDPTGTQYQDNGVRGQVS